MAKPAKPTAQDVREFRDKHPDMSVFDARLSLEKSYSKAMLAHLRSCAGEVYTLDVLADVVRELIDFISER